MLPPTDCLGKEEKQICFLLNRLLLDQRRVVPVCWGFIYKTLWNLNCHCLSKEGSLVHSIAQSFGCPIAHTEIFAKGHSNLDLVQRFLPELVLRGRQVLLGRICSVNLLSCYWRDNVSRVCRSDLFNQETQGRWSLSSLTSEMERQISFDFMPAKMPENPEVHV